MKATKIVIVPETHWDREWYLTFNNYRARLVVLMDKLLDILRSNPDYKNFTMDGQAIPIEDYLEVRPQFESEISKYVKEGRLSIGPMYVLPDEFLVSGESIVRNLLIGHKVSEKLGKAMKAGYIPDPFGHIAQLPQILSGFEVNSMLFARGFGDDYEQNHLNMEFTWEAPGNAASIMGIHLVEGYGSVADIIPLLGIKSFKAALRRVKRAIARLEEHTATPNVLLNNGSDHMEAAHELPELIKLWNEQNPDQLMEQADFEHYAKKVLEANGSLKAYQGELRGGRYQMLLSGVFSARMWIKQRNAAIEHLYEKYAEPAALLAWALDGSKKFVYPDAYILRGYKWLIQNHPHDSICGCSVDQVHDEMKTRFDWAEQIGSEIFAHSIAFTSDSINDASEYANKNKIILFNPLPWRRRDIVKFHVGWTKDDTVLSYPNLFKIIDASGNEIEYQSIKVKPTPESEIIGVDSYLFSFIAEIPAFGYQTYYIDTKAKRSDFELETNELRIGNSTIENNFYLIKVNPNGIIDILDKIGNEWYKDAFLFEDCADWGDEYDFSGPNEGQSDKIFTTLNSTEVKASPFINGSTHKSLKIELCLELSTSLSKDRKNRAEELLQNRITMYISLYKNINRVDVKIDLDNKSKDHRLRVIVPTNIKSERVLADGHFNIISRKVELPKVHNWVQDPLPTNHQKDFSAVSKPGKTVAVFNKGLPEYEALKTRDGTIALAPTLLRCIEWLSRSDLATRKGGAGPTFLAPKAQCLGEHSFELALAIVNGKSSLIEAEIHNIGKEFNDPLKVVSPVMAKSKFRVGDELLIYPSVELILNPTTLTNEPLKKSLPPNLSFLEIENKRILLSALKKSEEGNYVILRCYNIADTAEKTAIHLFERFKIKSAEIVNLLERKHINPIKASLKIVNSSAIELELKPHVIATIKINIE